MSSALALLNRRQGLRRLLAFRLRTLLLVILAVSTLLAWQHYRLHRGGIVAPIHWDIATGENIKWVVPLGSQSYGPPVVAGGKVFVGTNNNAGYSQRYPASVDLGVLLCFRAQDGQFLWQASSPKLPTGRDHDWPLQGIVSRPLVEGDRLWYVTNRCEVVCLDTEGFYDHQDDGAVKEVSPGVDDADVVWKIDMFNTLGVRPHNMSTCSPATDDKRLFIVTSNGVDESHRNIPAPHAPSFLALDKLTGKVLWTDNSPGSNILHGQWGSPVYAVLRGVPQVIFPGGDGWVYSFDPAGTPQGTSKLLWKFDMNPKTAGYAMGGRGTRIVCLLSATIYDERVYLTGGDDPEHGEGPGHIWCIDPTKRGDISAELVLNPAHPGQPVPPRRIAAVDAAAGDYVGPNPNSAVVWHYDQFDNNCDGVIAPDEMMHRSLGNVVILDGTLVATDFSGYVHFLDAASGMPLMAFDLFAACWCSPLVSGQHIYACDEEGKVTVSRLFTDAGSGTWSWTRLDEIDMGQPIYAVPTVANRVMYLVTQKALYAISESENYKAAKAKPAQATGS